MRRDATNRRRRPTWHPFVFRLACLSAIVPSLAASRAIAALPPVKPFEIVQAKECRVVQREGNVWRPLAVSPFKVGERVNGDQYLGKPEKSWIRKDGEFYAIATRCLKVAGAEALPDPEGVDLSTLGSEPATGAGGGASASGPASGSPHGKGGGLSPNFKIYFDFALYSRPGISDFTFDSFHNLVLVEILPAPNLQFSFDLNPNPRYFELDYDITPRLQVRVGKIWVPFDDMSPHNIFGGRVNVTRLSPGAAFLPDLWTDLGVGLKYQLIDSMAFSAVVHAYVQNGFRDGGTDPKTPGGAYPSFSDLPTSPDNNRDKAVGGRLSATIMRKLGLGLSYYSARWNASTVPEGRGLSILGADAQLRLGRTELRAGLAKMSVALADDSFARGGTYVEVGQKFGEKENWKGLLRAGQLQLDDRVVDVTDQRIVGATALWAITPTIQVSLEHSRDLLERSKKKNYSFTAARIVMAF